MMSKLDFSSWQAVTTTLLGLVVVTVLMVVIRLVLWRSCNSDASVKTVKSTNACAR